MSAINKRNNDVRYEGNVTVVKNLKSHASDPYILKKLEQAKAILSKVDLSNIEKK